MGGNEQGVVLVPEKQMIRVRRSIRRAVLIAGSLIVIPKLAHASGGGPLLLIFNASVFVVGQLWIVAVEYLIYKRFVCNSAKDAISDMVSINVFSTIAIAFFVPLIVAAIGIAGSFLPGDAGRVAAALGTWVCDGCRYNHIALAVTFLWFVLLFLMTVYFEALILKKKWTKRGLRPPISTARICWYTNSVSYLGLLVGILVIWSELLQGLFKLAAR